MHQSVEPQNSNCQYLKRRRIKLSGIMIQDAWYSDILIFYACFYSQKGRAAVSTFIYSWTLVRSSGIFHPLKWSRAISIWNNLGAKLKSAAEIFSPLMKGPWKNNNNHYLWVHLHNNFNGLILKCGTIIFLKIFVAFVTWSIKTHVAN